ncbi:TPR repeat region-containing protein [Halostreptopolyspora alba]|uniref:TPR repeat domain-containing protein n=1 Tax=Halostreptopolyspora alba TaxID=2487137 RepID=A0A3N0E968_9ACTN|nr:hypothetical protein EFW17_12505 [Nocardiopsaceae bacterium YIM 96095]
MAEFSPKECDANVGGLRSNSDDIVGLMERITGKSGDLKAKLNDSAIEFSELIADDLKSVAEENHGAWKKTLLACEVARAVMDKWADDVEWYRNQIDSLQEQWDDGPTVGRGDSESEIEDKKDKLAGQLNDEADAKWQELKRRADENSEMLEDGPEGDLRPLFEAGVMGWSAYNLANDIKKPQYMPANRERAEKYARDLQPYLNGDKEPDEDYYEMVAFLASINKRATEKQEEGGRLSHSEINFLETLYEDLDGSRDNLLEIPEETDTENSDFSDEQREDLLSAMGGNLLALSHEDLGGDYSRMPDSVHKIMEGPDSYGSPAPGNTEEHDANRWARDADKLGALLGHTSEINGQPMEGGTEFSARMTGVVGHVANGIHDGTYDIGFGDPEYQKHDSTLESLLDVSTRNKDANHAILTGDDNYVNPDFGRGEVIEGIFAYDWEDDGETAAGLTEWIHEDYCGPHVPKEECEHDSGEHDRAGEAMYGLIEEITSGQTEEHLRDTGIEIDRVDNSAFTRVNPEIGESLTDAYITFLNDFSVRSENTQGYGELHTDQVNTSPFHEDGDTSLMLDPDQKQGFLQFLVADETQATRVSAFTQDQEQRFMGIAMDSEGSTTPTAASRSAGELRGALDGALFDEYNSQLDTVHEARAKTRTALEAGRIGLSTTASSFGGPAGAGSAMTIGTLINDPVVERGVEMLSEDPKNSDNYSISRDELGNAALVDREAVNDHVTLQAANAIVAREDLDASQIGNFDENLIKNGELAQDIWVLENSGGSRRGLIDQIRGIITGHPNSEPPSQFQENIPHTQWKNSPTGEDLNKFINDYQDSYSDAYHDRVNAHEPGNEENDKDN